MKTTLFNRLTAGLLAAVLCLSVLAGCAAKPQKELTRYSTIFYDCKWRNFAHYLSTIIAFSSASETKTSST